MSAPAVHHPVFARVWTRCAPVAETAEHRRELLMGAHGRVIEVGAGNGLNFAHYPSTVREVVAVEPEPYLRRRAEAAAPAAPVPVAVHEGLAESLPAPDDAFDVAVCSLVLCSVADQAAALAEVHRVLRPGGELRFYEHVRARGRWATALQAGLDGSGVYPFLAGGCHLGRDTLAAIEAAGLDVERCRRFRVPDGPLGLPHALGLARCPG